MTNSLNWACSDKKIILDVVYESGAMHFVDAAGNEVMVAKSVWGSDVGMWWMAQPNAPSNLPLLELYSITACEHYAFLIHQTLLDTGH